MNFIKRILVLLYVTMMIFVGVFTLFLVLGKINIVDVAWTLQVITIDESLRLIGIIGAVVLLVLNFIFYKNFSVNVRRGKNIAFDNPSGRVRVSLFALEDLLKRRVSSYSEVREAKVRVTASRKGLEVKIKMTLRSETNIPEFTSRIQDSAKAKVQDIIGLEEPVSVLVFIGKIIPERVRERQVKSSDEQRDEQPEPNIPFRGYRA